MKQISFKISYHNGDAQDGRLDMYDASVSLQGFAKALSITTHALLNDGEIRKKGNSINGAKLYINPSRKGSFEELITLAVENSYAVAIGTSVIANVFYDLVKWTWSKTLDQEYKPETAQVKKLEERVEPFIGEMEEALEIPLEQAHRPIKKFDNMVIVIKRSRIGEIVRLDSETLKSVSIQTEQNVIRDISGNVTRYNILSGIGRFYDDNLKRTVSFKLDENASSSQRRRITWSLHHAQEPGQGKIRLDVKRVVSAKGITRRYLVQNVSRA
ncbi:hypothetical protein DNJ95_02270 [Stutzerimonas kirkiae]|uniref:Uncharacterized protein n=1 Tax=Stutzerimonas kirkiae TaxID=2211392 RepID=A0A4Q9RE92_9GAMM|nr:hypothetical protein [Stutzerimonas kirkiae]TBV00009.1 hypothetical protein DNJ96_01600 [Stutzerimonas kirkiae]TBV05714.1 hypothetical protein DNJ95_02270 [Stutzerimonas kirkiae]